jgi:hypothetical protein
MTGQPQFQFRPHIDGYRLQVMVAREWVTVGFYKTAEKVDEAKRKYTLLHVKPDLS